MGTQLRGKQSACYETRTLLRVVSGGQLNRPRRDACVSPLLPRMRRQSYMATPLRPPPAPAASSPVAAAPVCNPLAHVAAAPGGADLNQRGSGFFGAVSSTLLLPPSAAAASSPSPSRAASRVMVNPPLDTAAAPAAACAAARVEARSPKAPSRALLVTTAAGSAEPLHASAAAS